LILGALAASLVLPSMAATPVRVPVDDLVAGQTGFGLSVFRGTEPDTFTVTILGVQRGARADGDLVLVELSGQGLETSAVAQGMSGSPVYLDDGRLVGAVAFGWSGALRPIAGVTPAADLDAARDRPTHDHASVAYDQADLDPAALLGHPASGQLAARLLPSARPAGAVPRTRALPLDGWPSADDLALALLPLGQQDGRPGDPTHPLSLSLYSRPAGSAAAASGNATLVAGSACAVSLVSGDAQLGAIGTVSLVEGSRVVCMAHPFMQLGPVDLPLATAEIITMFPSREMSFKLGSAGATVGRVTHDLRAGLAGELGAMAPVTLVDVEVVLPIGTRHYSFAVARHATLTPPLVFWCLYNALLAEGDDRSMQQVGYEVAIDLATEGGTALPTVALSGVTGGQGGVEALSSDWQAPLSLLLSNRHQRVAVTRVTARLEVTRPVQALTITGVRAPARLTPGAPFSVEVLLAARHGGQVRERFDLIAPTTLPDVPLRLGVGSAREFFQLDAVRASGLFADHSLAATIDLLNRPRSLDELVVALVAPEPGLTAGGREYADLPGSVRRTLSRGPVDAVAPTQASYLLRASRRLGVLVLGTAVQELDIAPAPTTHREGVRP
jgi:hypothetical protein